MKKIAMRDEDYEFRCIWVGLDYWIYYFVNH